MTDDSSYGDEGYGDGIRAAGADARDHDPDEYLGDGVHASHDGWHVTVSTAQHGPIYLDPSVVRALVRYAARHGVVIS